MNYNRWRDDDGTPMISIGGLFTIITPEQYIKLTKEENNMNNNELDLIGLLADNTPDGKEVDMEKSTLQKIVFKDKEISTRWEDLDNVTGYYTEQDSNIGSALADTYYPVSENTNIYATYHQCAAHLAQAKLSQIMKKVNGDWVADWEDTGQRKYCIILCKNKYSIDSFTGYNKFLSFKSKTLAEQVLRENKDLLGQYKPLAG